MSLAHLPLMKRLGLVFLSKESSDLSKFQGQDTSWEALPNLW